MRSLGCARDDNAGRNVVEEMVPLLDGHKQR